MIRRGVVLAALLTSLVTLTLALARQSATASPAQQTAKPASPADDPSGMYSFLREGEFFDKATLAGDRLSFKTKTVHAVWYEFTGVINITPGKQPGQEDYRVLKGTLTQHTIDASSHDKAIQRQVEFKAFPQDLSKP